jgi:hypothetical protein
VGDSPAARRIGTPTACPVNPGLAPLIQPQDPKITPFQLDCRRRRKVAARRKVATPKADSTGPTRHGRAAASTTSKRCSQPAPTPERQFRRGYSSRPEPLVRRGRPLYAPELAPRAAPFGQAYSVGPSLRLPLGDVHRSVLQPRRAARLSEGQSVGQESLVVAIGEIAARVRAARLLAGQS